MKSHCAQVEAAEEWDARALAFVEQAQAERQARPSIADLRALVADGLATGETAAWKGRCPWAGLGFGIGFHVRKDVG